jgi:hypothetical protein
VDGLSNVLAGLAALTAEVARLADSSAKPADVLEPADRLLTVGELAQRLHCSTRSVRRRATTYPFARHTGRTWLFSEKGFMKWLDRQRP